MYILIRIVYFITELMSFHALRKTGMFVGSLAYLLSKKRRKIAEKNCMAIGCPDCAQVVKQSFRHSFATYAESFYAHRIDKNFLDSVEIENPQYMNVDKTRGYFLVSAHIGCWELVPNIMSSKLGIRGAAIARKLKNEKVDEFLVKQRVSENVLYLHHRNIADRIPELLDEGITVGALLDHSATTRDSMFVPMFGVNTTFIKGVPLISVRKDIPIIPTFLIRTEKGFKMVMYPLIEPDRSLKPKERIYDIAKRINDTYEDIIRKYPEQWYLLHKRFKKTMDAEGNITESFYQ